MYRRIILTGLICCVTGIGLSAAEITPEVKKSLDESLENWVSLYNKHDAKALGKEYTRDAVVIMPTGEKLTGRQAIVKDLTDTFAKNPDIRIRLSDISRRQITPRIVIEEGRWEELNQSEVGLPKSGLYSAILVKRQDRWISKYEVGFVPVSPPNESN